MKSYQIILILGQFTLLLTFRPHSFIKITEMQKKKQKKKNKNKKTTLFEAVVKPTEAVLV